jgi:hypothetical protein
MMERPGFIYLATSGDGKYKIGRTMHARDGIVGIEDVHIHDVCPIIVAFVPRPEQYEAFMRSLFEDKLLKNGWYFFDLRDIARFDLWAGIMGTMYRINGTEAATLFMDTF